jgi:hypothetical protein
MLRVRLQKRDIWCYDVVVVSRKGKIKKKVGSINMSAESLSHMSLHLQLTELRNFLKLGAFISPRIEKFLKHAL